MMPRSNDRSPVSSQEDPLLHLWEAWDDLRREYEQHGCPLGRSTRALEIWVEYGVRPRLN